MQKCVAFFMYMIYGRSPLFTPLRFVHCGSRAAGFRRLTRLHCSAALRNGSAALPPGNAKKIKVLFASRQAIWEGVRLPASFLRKLAYWTCALSRTSCRFASGNGSPLVHRSVARRMSVSEGWNCRPPLAVETP